MIGNGIPPDAPTNLRANGWFGFASLEWVNPTNADLSHIEVWENDKDELATASIVGQTRADSFTRMLPAGGTKWYWVRAVNYTGQKSDYNDQAGTPCIVDPESAEAWITDYLERNPWIQEALEELNTRIDPLEIDIADINLELNDIKVDLDDIDIALANVDIKLADFDDEIADLQGQVTDNRNEINNNLATAMDMIAEGVLRLADQADYVGDVFRWAGMEIYPEDGLVVIRALEDLKTDTGYQFSNVEQRLDAQAADINLKASRAYVDQSVASIIAAIIAAEEWKFNNTLNGWTAQNATLTAQPVGMLYSITGATPSLTSPDFSIPGNVNNIVGIQFSQTGGAANAVIKVQYKTAAHGFSDSYMRRINVVGDITFTRSVQINMHDLTAGGDDWKNSTITGIRLLIGAEAGQEYQINFVNIGQSSMSDLALQDLELRITQAEIDIDGANAAISLKADETTVTALQQRLNSAEVRIDGLNSAIALKADQTTVEGVNVRLQSAEVEIDALNGMISQQVVDYEGLQGQIDDLSAASLQNSINEHEGQEERRLKLALARQELNARIDETNQAVATYRLELLAIIDESSAYFGNEIQAIANGLTAEVQARETLQVRVNSNTAAIQTEQTTRASADESLSTRITSLQSKVDTNTAEIQTEQQTRATADSVLASQITTIQAYEGMSAEELQAQIDALTAASFQNSVNEHEGQEERRIKLALAREELNAQIDETNRAVAEYRLQLLAVINENSAIYDRKIQAVADDLSAEVTTRETLAATVGQNTAAIRNEQTARTNADSALSSQITILQSKVGNNTAAIQAEAKARADADKVEADARNTLQGKVEQNTAAIEDERRLRIQGDEAEATARTQMQAKINEDIKAAVKKETEARVTSESAIVSDVSTIQTTLEDPRTGKGLIASVQQNAQAIANTNGTLETKYTLKLDSNGYVVGYQLYNGGDSKSTFTLSADSFVVAKPGSTNPRQMLVYDSASGMLVLNSLMVNRASMKEACVDTLILDKRAVTIPKGLSGINSPTWGDKTIGTYYYIPAGGGGGNILLSVPQVVAGEPIYLFFTCNISVEMCYINMQLRIFDAFPYNYDMYMGQSVAAFANEKRTSTFSYSGIITPERSGTIVVMPMWRVGSIYGTVGTSDYKRSYFSHGSILALQCKR